MPKTVKKKLHADIAYNKKALEAFVSGMVFEKSFTPELPTIFEGIQRTRMRLRVRFIRNPKGVFLAGIKTAEARGISEGAVVHGVLVGFALAASRHLKPKEQEEFLKFLKG